MKEGWEYKKFGEVCWYNKNNGLHKSTRYVGMEHIEQGTGRLLCTISSDDVLSNTFAFNKGDVLYGRLRPYLKKVIVADFDGCCSTELFPIQSKDIIAPFLKYWFLTDEITNKINATCAGCRMPRGNMNDVLKFDISYPSISEQQSIVDYLDSAFAKIDAMKANAEKSLNEAKALFQASLKEMLEPKEGWEEKKFGKLCDFVRGPFGGSLKKECFKDSGYAVYEQQNAIYNKFSFRYFIDEDKYQSLIRFKVNSGDLIMSCSGTIGKVAIIPENCKEGIINQALLKLTPQKEIDAHFLKYLMESNYFEEIINANIEGVAIKNIASVAILKEIKLYIPKVSEQHKIVIEIDSLKSKVDRLQENYDKISQECDALKQAILREVFE